MLIIGQSGCQMEPRGTLFPMTSQDVGLDAELVARVVDPHFDRSMAAGSAPGLVFAVLLEGVVVYSHGLGSVDPPEGGSPDNGTVFRIASMTKSFTAAALLGLRDEGRLSLDAPVIEFVPEISAGGPVAKDITVRHLLTMGGGLLTDDPWGDRQQDLPVTELRQLIGKGLTPLWRPGLRFEYSNLGYALLGLVIEAVTGRPYREAVEQRLLKPLGMMSTGFSARAVAPSTVARGFVRRSTGWVEEPLASAGAFSPMGGLLSTVDDLAKWVGLFQAVHLDPSPPGLPPGLTASAASLLEMQVTQRLVSATCSREPNEAPDVTGYGLGLFEDFRSWGRSVYHSGGYPGFGSHMRWHPATGLGIIALANSTYAPMSTVATAALGDLVEQSGRTVRSGAVRLPMLEVAQIEVTAWLEGADPEAEGADTIRGFCADNVELDVPWPERVAVWHALRRSHGVLHAVAHSETHPSPGSVRWQMCGQDTERRVQVTVLLAPHDQRLVQSIDITAIDPAGPQSRASTEWT